MQLIGSYTSPFVRKIRVLLIEKGIPFSLLEDIPWNADSKAPGFNPLGKVPILIDEHGHTWFDSPVIAAYIEALHTKHRLIPNDPVAAVEVRQIEALADGIVEAAIAVFLERKRPPEKQSKEWIERQNGKVERGIASLEKRITGKQWFHAENYSLADIAVGVVLGWIDLRFPDLGWRDQAPSLARHYEKLSGRPSFQETRPPAG